MYNLQTHIGFTNIWSNKPRFCVISSQRVKNGTRTPCKCNKSTFEIQQRQLRSMAPFVAASQLKADETMILLDRYSHYQQSWCTAYNCV